MQGGVICYTQLVTIPPSWKKVTPFSKALAFALFIAMPFIGFFLGVKYQRLLGFETRYIEKIKLVKTQYQETPRDLLERCGDFPSDSTLKLVPDPNAAIMGPFWSSDCRNVAWSVSNKGLYLYSDTSRNTSRIYAPKEGEVINLKGWHGVTQLYFTKGYSDRQYNYDLVSRQVTEIFVSMPVPDVK